MPLILATLFLLLTFSMGWLLATWFGVKPKLEKVATSALLGFWLITILMMVAYQITGRFGRELTLGIAGLTNLGLWWAVGKELRDSVTAEWRSLVKNARRQFQTLTHTWHQLSRLEQLLLVIVFLIIGQTTWSNLTWPVADWDSIALYDFRAILMKIVGTWADGKKLGYFYHYPPFTSLLHGAMYLMGINQVKIVYSWLFVSFLGLFYSFVRQQTTRLQAIIGVFLLTISPLFSEHITVAYTNLPYTIYFAAGAMYLWRWLANHQNVDMKLAFIFTAAACWVRASEPFWVIIFLMLIGGRVWLVKNVSWKTFAAYSLLFLALVRYWPEYDRSLDLPAPPPPSNQARLIDAITPVTLVEHVFTVSSYLITNAVMPLLYLLLPASIVTFFDRTVRKNLILKSAVVTLVLLAMSVGAGTYFFSFTYNTWDAIGPSLSRMMMSVVPLLIYLICVSDLWATVFKYVTFASKTSRKPKKH